MNKFAIFKSRELKRNKTETEYTKEKNHIMEILNDKAILLHTFPLKNIQKKQNYRIVIV